jgi:hypothetical protein
MLLERRDLSSLFTLVRVSALFLGAALVVTASAVGLVIML